MEIKETTYKGTRILFGEDATFKLNTIGHLRNIAERYDFEPMLIPIIQKQETFSGKVGTENNNLMFNLNDRKGRNLCLAPEYTAVVQALATTIFKQDKNVKIFYCQETFRGEKPQAGRFRQFTQFGVEILNPTEDFTDLLIEIATEMVKPLQPKYVVNRNVTRGLDYYEAGKGFEIVCDELGGAKQLLGGGSYENGIGFAIGVDRLIL